MDRYDNDINGPEESSVGFMLNRRRTLQAGAALAAGTVGLAACSGGGGKSFTGSNNKGGESQPQGSGEGIAPTPRAQTVIVDQSDMTVFDRFNPFIPNGENYQGGVGQVVKEWLWYANLATGETKAWLGESYSYSKDYKQVTLKLNPKAKWSDGKPFTSADVAFTYQMLKKNPTLLGATGTYVTEVEKVSTPDPQTVILDLNTPDPRYHYNFICGIVSAPLLVMPEHVWSGQDPTKFDNNPPIYTGPYKLNKTIADHKMFIWEKTDNYWNKDEMDPAPKYVVYRTNPSTDADLQQFKQGQIDVGGAPNMYELVNNAIKGGYKNATITKMVDPCPRGIHINCDPSKGALADPRMRQAISALVDREKIGNSIWQVKCPPAVYPWPNYPNNDKWNLPEVAKKYPLSYDPKKAEQLLDEMGATKGSNGKRTYQGKPISFEIITPVTTSDPEYFIGQLLATDLKKVGIDAHVKALSGSVYDERNRQGKWDIRSEWLCGELLDPYQLYSQFDSKYYVPVGKTDTQSNSERLKDPKLTEDIKKLSSLSPTADEAKPIFEDALTHWYEAMPVIAEIQTTYTHQFNTTYWTNWPTNDNLYQVPNNWWGQFMFVIGSLKPTGKK